ncbi:hypothetical protein V2J09_022856 [Rumex salicifolius]
MLSIIAIVLIWTLLLIIVALVYFYMPYGRVRRVPGPPLMPFLGHLPLLAKYGPDVFSILAKQYGPVYRFHMGRQALVIVADAEVCREVGIRKFKYFPNRSIPSPISASPLHQKGLFFSRDSRWSSMRNTIISMYQPSHLASLVPTMQTFIKSAVQSNIHSNHHNLDFSSLSIKLATDVIGQAAFGINFGLSNPSITTTDPNHEASDFISQHIYSTTALKMDLSGSLSIIIGLLFPILQQPFRQLFRRLPYSMDWIMERTDEKLTSRLKRIVLRRFNDKERVHSKDFLSLIVNSKLFTPEYISALTYEHLLAGSATTAFTLSSVVYLVSSHPDVEMKLVEEIDEFGPRDQDPTAHDLQHKFPYMDQVIKEAMRIYTVSPLVAREAAAPVEVGGYLLPKGTWVWLAPGVLAKDSKNFPEPHKFKPERFDPSKDEEKKRHPYAHIPFGIGPRACIGHKFALQEIKLSLIHLYRSYLFRHSTDMETPLELQYGMVLNFKNGVKLRVINRT